MGSKPISSQGGHNPTRNEADQSRDAIVEDEVVPIYYDSEPSSQPPKYLNIQNGTASTSQYSQATTSPALAAMTTPIPPNTHRNSAPAATVAAVLASPYEDLDTQRREHRKNKTLRQRWRDFKDRNFHDDGDEVGSAGVGSAAEWNVMGGKLSSGQPSPYRKEERK
jgi:hypothetical protein